MRNLRALFVVAVLVISANTFSFALDGVDYTEFEIHGTRYHVPIPNKQVREDFYHLHKALDGDDVSRKLLLGGKDSKYFYIGDVGVNRWLVLTKDDVRVVTNN